MKLWKTVLGRGGTTLIAISLALLLVSLIPQTQSSSTKGSIPIRAGQFSVMFSPGTITPQQEIQVNITVKGTLTIYLLEIKVSHQFMNGTFGYEFNLTDLQELLKEHPEQVLLEPKVENSGYKLNYIPSRIMNATIAVYNNASEIATLDFDMALKSSLAPGDKVRTIAYFAAPIGVVMAVPWLLSGWKQRKQK
jgi:hypothetical protein